MALVVAVAVVLVLVMGVTVSVSENGGADLVFSEIGGNTVSQAYFPDAFVAFSMDGSGESAADVAAGVLDSLTSTTSGNENITLTDDVQASVRCELDRFSMTQSGDGTLSFVPGCLTAGAGVTVSPTSGLLTGEDGTSTGIEIVLTRAPAAEVTIGVSSSDTGEGTVSPASVSFTGDNWATPQTVTVTGVDDDAIDGDIGYSIETAAAVSADTGYSGLNPLDVLATNQDNDGATAGDILGTMVMADDVTHKWTPMTFNGRSFNAPVVIAGPPSYHGVNPGVVRLRGVTSTGFELAFREWDYRSRLLGDNAHTGEDIGCLVIEAGRHVMGDGSVWEAGTFQQDGTGDWRRTEFSAAFAGRPQVFLTTQTANGGQTVTVRARSVDASGFESALYEEEALMDGHVVETVGYLAVHGAAGSGETALLGGATPYLLQNATVDERRTPVWSSYLTLEEEMSVDSETRHVDEDVDVLVVGNQLFAQETSANGNDTVALRQERPEHSAQMEWGVVDGVDHNWTTIPLAKSGYLDPVVVAKPVSTHGGHPGVIRMQGINPAGFRMRFQEWDYLDGGHADERVFYLVADAGAHTLAGLDVQAGHIYCGALSREGCWSPVSFLPAFASAPSVFGSVETSNGGQAVTVRMKGLDAAGFSMAMDEQENRTDGHVEEALGWIAVERGIGMTDDGRRIRVLQTSLDDIPKVIPFEAVAGRFPVVVSEVTSTYGADPVFIRYQGLDTSGIELYLDEEQSADSETWHTDEDVSVFIGE